MEKNQVKIFFDESGKRSNKPTTMGGILIPKLVYESEIIQSINNRLQNKEFELHWKNYGGDSEKKQIILDIISYLMKFSSLISFNIINYKKPNDCNWHECLFEEMVYTKLPERIFYGLLRNYGSDASLEAEVFIEKATEYEGRKLKENIPHQLNIQAMYRGENYKIVNCEYKEKNKEIGVEVVDLLLGIIRNIILNKNDSNKNKAKNELVVELLKNKNFYSFLSKINYFEWSSDDKLKKVEFHHYIQLFLSKQEMWINYLAEK
ncbi:DUF3800 domain-containing protein [Clostridium sporogenes]|uniref:DUF3800 domain-containing protein n=1 Tax=Clostridium TaxID=1485 RepID=UPI000772DAC9|nr:MULTISPECIES: DUF3800 domain-containing protein [Clostridium]MBY6886481.1 DUF3800 domain-containing protein [Clostridium botulinum]NFD96768.1 DUF3800 domain-containing protein [Clostridium botulinum]NFI45032.1 DUF3800 domain-containing protein [Clostridium botulinum]NFJ82916.1 DUF3800 domain-containing protein [Clostridium botulinum]NFJ89669.1 DUF3800 domain-containing protein [Clostridium botulinum]